MNRSKHYWEQEDPNDFYCRIKIRLVTSFDLWVDNTFQGRSFFDRSFEEIFPYNISTGSLKTGAKGEGWGFNETILKELKRLKFALLPKKGRGKQRMQRVITIPERSYLAPNELHPGHPGDVRVKIDGFYDFIPIPEEKEEKFKHYFSFDIHVKIPCIDLRYFIEFFKNDFLVKAANLEGFEFWWRELNSTHRHILTDYANLFERSHRIFSFGAEILKTGDFCIFGHKDINNLQIKDIESLKKKMINGLLRLLKGRRGIAIKRKIQKFLAKPENKSIIPESGWLIEWFEMPYHKVFIPRLLDELEPDARGFLFIRKVFEEILDLDMELLEILNILGSFLCFDWDILAFCLREFQWDAHFRLREFHQERYQEERILNTLQVFRITEVILKKVLILHRKESFETALQKLNNK